jgi:hypothetical protein
VSYAREAGDVTALLAKVQCTQRQTDDGESWDRAAYSFVIGVVTCPLRERKC